MWSFPWSDWTPHLFISSFLRAPSDYIMSCIYRVLLGLRFRYQCEPRAGEGKRQDAAGFGQGYESWAAPRGADGTHLSRSRLACAGQAQGRRRRGARSNGAGLCRSAQITEVGLPVCSLSWELWENSLWASKWPKQTPQHIAGGISKRLTAPLLRSQVNTFLCGSTAYR